MRSVSVQIGPRSVGRCCAAWGLVIARNKTLSLLILATVAAEGLLAVVMVLLSMATGYS